MKTSWLFVLVVGASCSKPPGAPQETTEDTAATASETGGTTQATASDTLGTSTSTSTTSSSTAGPEPTTSSTGEPPRPPEEVCAQAKSHDECVALWPSEELTCIWGETVEVEVVDGECVLGTAETLCAPAPAGGGQGCFDHGPSECLAPGFDLYVSFKETRGATWLWHQLPGGCVPPKNADWTTSWTACPPEEFEEVPDVCYCLCGGLPDDPGTGP